MIQEEVGEGEDPEDEVWLIDDPGCGSDMEVEVDSSDLNRESPTYAHLLEDDIFCHKDLPTC